MTQALRPYKKTMKLKISTNRILVNDVDLSPNHVAVSQRGKPINNLAYMSADERGGGLPVSKRGPVSRKL